MLRNLSLFAVLGAVLLACGTETQKVAAQPAAAPRAQSGLDIIPLEVRSGSRRHAFRVEVARTGAEQAQGMMFRERIGPNEGMLFPFAAPREASFWMKNVPIPLDIIFIRADGTIARIANAVPHSEDMVLSGEPVATVLEIAGGRAAELGIEEGDRVGWAGGPRL